jgi:tetraacyldisaccharide 4'-kinase
MNKVINSFIERGWYHGTRTFWPLLIVLWPLSLLFIVLARLRRLLLISQQNSNAVVPVSVPVIIVGNIAIGGTGKTPLLCALALAFIEKGFRPGIISRGYGGSYRGEPRCVSLADDASVVGDEPLLLACRTGCPVVIAQDRVAAARYLETQNVTVILSDDGLQHYALSRTVEIAVMDGQRGVGNGLCLPAGPLREPITRLQEVDFVVVNGETASRFRDDQINMSIQPVHWVNVHTGNVEPLAYLPVGSYVHAVAGIGNPQRFFNTLHAIGYKIIEHVFPDHHAFVASDLVFGDDLVIVMTEKDAVKCSRFAQDNTFALIVAATVPEPFLDALLDKISRKN